MDRNVAKYWYPNEKMVVTPVCLTGRCCSLHPKGAVGIFWKVAQSLQKFWPLWPMNKILGFETAKTVNFGPFSTSTLTYVDYPRTLACLF